jgi:hypothetical protein
VPPDSGHRTGRSCLSDGAKVDSALPAAFVACLLSIGAREAGECRASACGLPTEPAPRPWETASGFGGSWAPEDGAWSGPTRGFAQDTLQSERGLRRPTDGRTGGGRVPGRGRSHIGARREFLRPGSYGPGPEGGPPNPYSSTPRRSRSGLGIYVSTCSASDPTRHCSKGIWACMRAPTPHPMTAESQPEELGVIRPARSARAAGGKKGEGGKASKERAEGQVRRGRKGK